MSVYQQSPSLNHDEQDFDKTELSGLYQLFGIEVGHLL